MWRRVVLSWSLACSSALVALAQNPPQPAAAQVQILSPEPDSYLSGLTLLSATVDPLAAAASATFSVDGRVVCEMDLPPFQCEWDAGSNIVQRQVGSLRAGGGGRLVRTIRTKALISSRRSTSMPSR